MKLDLIFLLMNRALMLSCAQEAQPSQTVTKFITAIVPEPVRPHITAWIALMLTFYILFPVIVDNSFTVTS